MFLLDECRLQAARREDGHRDSRYLSLLLTLREQAEIARARPFRTVLDKRETPPSGDKHDYLSYGPYWWPNPDSPGGLPYVRRDGWLNPDTAQSDKTSLEQLMRDVATLALGFFYSKDEALAEAATIRLRAWFLDPATRMYPHLEYGQAIPGICTGRGIGIIDTVQLRLLPDVLTILKESQSWSRAENAALHHWLGQYLEWLLTSAHGLKEATEHNNHGTWYDVQVTLFAIATGREEVARDVLTQVPAKRFALHIAPDGSQPHELARTRSFSYSCYNLVGLFDLARLAEHAGLDLWNWRGEGGASLQRALEFLAPYAAESAVWPYEQVVDNDGSQLLELLQRAANAWPQSQWTPAIEQARKKSANAAHIQLMWPI